MLAILASATSATAQTAPPDEAETTEPGWVSSVAGLGSLLGERQGLGILIATPSDDEESGRVADLIEEELIGLGIAEVVMDDSALGSLEGLSDDAIIEKARQYPVDVVLVLRTFPGSSGPTVVLRVQSIDRPGRTFRLRRGHATQWSRPPQKPPAEAKSSNTEAKAVASHATERAQALRASAVAQTETIRLVEAELSRKLLTFEPHGRFGRVLDVEGDPVEWPAVYQTIGGDDLEQAWRSRRTVRTAAFVSGGILGAAGVGLLFVSLTNATNCGPETRETCASPAMTGLGALSLSVGALAVFTGLLVRPHPLTVDELEERVDRYNDHLSSL
jgi:hypothetical protein